ncbi:hypothetical protein KR52_08345 [Synechococcus sp. KORDI-52]|nr:hypothetical protein KR52_08345 [Synechococcus sp. KORDI-52]
MSNSDQLRNKMLREINAWCLQRASHLSLTGQEHEAQALTEEHMETLRNIRLEKTLWI